MLSPFECLCGNFILPEPASYVFFYAIFNLRKLLYIIDLEYAKPINIGSNCWLAGNVTVCGGVTIGEGCVIGAGSVVTRDIPPGCLAAGNPCRVIRRISEQDSVELKNLK